MLAMLQPCRLSVFKDLRLVMQARELADLTAKGRELRGRIKELSEALEKEQAANALVTSEIQVIC